MSERLPGCRVPFGSSEHIVMIPACMGGSALMGCVDIERCSEGTIEAAGSPDTVVSIDSQTGRESNASVLAQMGSSGYLIKLPDGSEV